MRGRAAGIKIGRTPGSSCRLLGLLKTSLQCVVGKGLTIDSRRGKGTGNIHILYMYIGKVWHMFSLVQFGMFNTFFCSFYELLMAFLWPKLSIEHSVTQG